VFSLKFLGVGAGCQQQPDRLKLGFTQNLEKV